MGFIRYEGKCFSQQHVGIVVENFILNNIVYFILLCYAHDVEAGYAIKVLCCNLTFYCFWQVEQPILLFILIIILLWLMLLSLGQMLLSPFYLFVIMVHDITEPCGCQGVARALVLWGLLLKFKFWWLDQHLIPYMWQLVLAYISI